MAEDLSLMKTPQPVPESPPVQQTHKEMTNTQTQSLTWGELTLEMLSEIVSQQVISVSQIGEHPHGHGPPCFHMKGIKWKDLIDMIISTHNVMCEQTGVFLSHNTVQVEVTLQDETGGGFIPFTKGVTTTVDPVGSEEHFMRQQADIAAGEEDHESSGNGSMDAYQSTIDDNRLTTPREDLAEDTLNNLAEKNVETDGYVKGLPAQCTVCKKRFKSRYMLKRHSIVHEENHNRHPCLYCDKVCKTECFLQRHMATHFKPVTHPLRRRRRTNTTVRKPAEQSRMKKEPARCSICNKTFTLAKNLKRHEKIHLKSDKHPCSHCDKVCKSAHYLQLHMMVHAEEKQHKCPDCDMSFGAKYKLKQHQTKEHNVFEQHECNVCGAVYRNKYTLEDHMIEHTGQKSYLCDTCGKTFNRPSAYRLHMAYHASRANPQAYRCPHCSKPYATKALLNTHVRSAHLKERNHKCSVCDRGFFTKQQLHKHEQVHSDVPAHLCSFCGKGFAQKHTYIAHRRRHMGDRPFVCQYCGKGFTCKPHLKIHERIHTSTGKRKRPFKCEKCVLTFTSKTAQKDHEKRHAGIKDHKCPECSGAFVSKSELIRHLRTHTGGKPFKCQHCDERFSKQIELTEHEATHDMSNDIVEIPFIDPSSVHK